VVIFAVFAFRKRFQKKNSEKNKLTTMRHHKVTFITHPLTPFTRRVGLVLFSTWCPLVNPTAIGMVDVCFWVLFVAEQKSV
jgi:hypothetical protein